MMILLYILLLITKGCCTEEYKFMTKTVPVGENVTLSCTRRANVLHRENLFWIRIASGKKPEFLGATINFDFKHDIQSSLNHITVNQSNMSFVLNINGAEESDDGVYYCLKVKDLDLVFLTGTFLRVKDREPNIVAVTERFLPDGVYPGEPVTLECSVLSNSHYETCGEEQRVFWFKTESNKSHPHVVYADGNGSDECLRSPEASSEQKCIYSFTKDFISSDAGTYYCAVAACGEIFYGNGTTLAELKMWDLQKANMVLLILLAMFSASILFIIILLYKLKKNSGTNEEDILHSAHGYQQIKSEDFSKTYSVAVFTERKAGRATRS